MHPYSTRQQAQEWREEIEAEAPDRAERVARLRCMTCNEPFTGPNPHGECVLCYVTYCASQPHFEE